MKKIDKKYLIIAISVIALLIILGLILCKFTCNKKLSDLEKIKITEGSDKYSNYFEYLDGSKKVDDYIVYALMYNYNENDKDSLSFSEIHKTINNIFSTKIKLKDIEDSGMSPSIVNTNISKEENGFKLNNTDKSYATIASTKIVKYNINNIEKINNNKYQVIYDKYIISNPYDVLNYYNDNNKTKETEEISSYLKGKGKITNIKKYINKKNQNKVGKKDKEITVTYVVKNNKVLIENIK